MNKSNPDTPSSESSQPKLEPEEPSKGPSLILMYTLIALAILLATAIAAIIVLPFYLRR